MSKRKKTKSKPSSKPFNKVAIKKQIARFLAQGAVEPIISVTPASQINSKPEKPLVSKIAIDAPTTDLKKIGVITTILIIALGILKFLDYQYAFATIMSDVLRRVFAS